MPGRLCWATRCARHRVAILSPQPGSTPLGTATQSWKVFAIFNHDLEQIYIGASDAPHHALSAHCRTQASALCGWEPRAHNIDWMEAVEEFKTLRHARAYANWLHREGAFEGTEDFAMGLEPELSC